MTPDRKALAAKVRAWQAGERSMARSDFIAIADLLDPPEPVDGIPVRIAVAADEDGGTAIYKMPIRDGAHDPWDVLHRRGHPIRLGIIEAVLPRPVVPVVKGRVET